MLKDGGYAFLDGTRVDDTPLSHAPSRRAGCSPLAPGSRYACTACPARPQDTKPRHVARPARQPDALKARAVGGS